MYQAILLPLDLNDANSYGKALPSAMEICRHFSADLHLLTVVPPMPPWVEGFFPEGFEDKRLDAARTALDELRKAQISPDIAVTSHVLEGKIYDVIIKAAAELRIDLIVMASHHPELRDYLLGPNAARVVRHSHCSVMVVRQ